MSTTAAQNTSNSQAVDLKQIAALLSTIALEALVLDELVLENADGTEKESFHALRTLTQKIGYLADLGASMTGGDTAKGSAEDWFLPPTYHDLARS